MVEAQRISPLIDSDELRRLDALYRSRPFEEFASWADSVLPTAALERFGSELRSVAQSRPHDFSAAVEYAARAAAFNTGAIEGLYLERGKTVTVAAAEPGWEAELSAVGERVPDFFESQLDGYRLAREVAADIAFLGEAWLRELHRHICAAQDRYEAVTAMGKQWQPLPKGEYKKHPNHVLLVDGSFHAYAPPDMVSSEMQRLIGELRTRRFIDAHSILKAAYAHYVLVAIHPFADGNGRTARALASAFLYEGSGVPLLIHADQGAEYLSSLEAVDRGNRQAFVDFMADRVFDTLQLVADRMAAVSDEDLRTLRELYAGQGGLGQSALDEVAAQVLSAVRSEFEAQVARLSSSLPEGVQVTQQDAVGGVFATPASYRRPVRSPRPGVLVTLHSMAPVFASAGLAVDTLVHVDRASRDTFRVQAWEQSVRRGAVPPGEAFTVRLKEAYPQLSTAFRLRVNAWVGRQLATLVRRLEMDAQTALGRLTEEEPMG